MLLVNCETNLMLNWSTKYVICKGDRETTFAITHTKFCVSVVNRQSPDNTRILKSSFKRTINWNKYWSTAKTLPQNLDLNNLIDSSFRRMKRLFVLSFEDHNGRTDCPNFKENYKLIAAVLSRVTRKEIVWIHGLFS